MKKTIGTPMTVTDEKAGGGCSFSLRAVLAIGPVHPVDPGAGVRRGGQRDLIFRRQAQRVWWVQLALARFRGRAQGR